MDNEKDKKELDELRLAAGASVIGAASGLATNAVAKAIEKSKTERENANTEEVVIETITLEDEQQDQTGGASGEDIVEVQEEDVEELDSTDNPFEQEDIVNPNDEFEEIEVVYGGPPIDDDITDIDIVQDVYGAPIDDIPVDY